MDIDNLGAGQEMDALVAEKVMGFVPQKDFGEWSEHDWKRNKDGTIDEIAADSEYYVGPLCIRCYYSNEGGGIGEKGVCKKKPRPYSTSISAAWEVVEKIYELACDGKLHPGFRDPVITVKLFERMHFCSMYEASCGYANTEEFEGVEIKAPTAPLAICRAAMKAVNNG